MTMTKLIRTYLMVAVFGLVLAGVASAVDFGEAASEASKKIDQALQGDAAVATEEMKESWDKSNPNADQELAVTADKANQDLDKAGKRDDYTMARRELETTRSLTFPGTPEYNALTEQINKLDADFAASQK